MKIKLISVGRSKDKNLHSLIEEYKKKISYDAKLEVLEIKDSNPEEEGRKILELLNNIKEPSFVFALSEEGKEHTSTEFAHKLRQLSFDRTIVFVIGGPFGLSEKAKENAELLSLSKMTFTHEMARLFLLEQIYRALSIIKNKKYHK
jgi:23S rRNA (pseudouridine1915-N3)-methyltransferase